MSSNETSILIIDDEFENIQLLEAMLQMGGYTVFAAGDGIEGRKIALEKQPGIILLDVMMPNENGFETCRKLKQNAATADIPVIFVSSLHDTDSVVKGLTVGGLDYIRKPFKQDEVMARVKNYLKLRHSYLRVIEEQAIRLRQIQDAQKSILVTPEGIPEANFGVVYQPFQEAGSDFYDVFKISSNFFGYFVAAVSGHKISASYLMSALKALIRQNSSLLYSPDETIRIVNSVLLSVFTGDQHLTAAYIHFDQNNFLLYLVNAAHSPVLVLENDGKVRWLVADSDLIGVSETAHFTCQCLPVSGGERFFIFSTGLLTSINDSVNDNKQGMSDLANFAIKTRKMTIQSATKEIVKLMFAGEKAVEDDLILLGIDI